MTRVECEKSILQGLKGGREREREKEREERERKRREREKEKRERKYGAQTSWCIPDCDRRMSL